MDDLGQRPVSRRIGVANLDAVEQTRLWLTLGADEATRTLLGALRTALLLAETVVIDRNQLFEGIFFMAMTPDRLAWHLGLPPGSHLPLTVALLNPADGDLSSDHPPPWPTDHGRVWAHPDEVMEQIERNHMAVPGDRQRVSSPLIALTGRYEADDETDGPSVNAPHSTQAWREGVDPDFIPAHVWQRRDATLASEVVRRGREQWLHAMKHGRVSVEPWRRSPINIGPALERTLPQHDRARELALALMELEEGGGITAPCRTAHAGLDTDEQGNPLPCGRTHVTKRSLVVRWLDGHHVEGLSPATLPPVWREASFAERETAFRWWTGAYYEAICARDDLQMLRLHNIGAADDPGTSTATDLDIAWGLRRPVPSRPERVRTRLSHRALRPSDDLEIEGEVVRHLVEMGPWQFARLRSMEVVDRDALWTEPSSRKMFDLALAVRDVAGSHTSRRTRVLIASGRMLALGLLAAAFAFRDAGHLPTSGAALAVSWILLGIAAAFPWDSVASLLRMSRGELESSLRVRP